MAVTTGGLTPEEEALLIALLGKVRQPYSMQFFEALTDVMPVVAFEAVILRKHEGRRQIMLVWRKSGNAAEKWPNRWTVPGTVVRVTDPTLDAIMDRLARTELGIESFASCQLAGVRLLHGKDGHGRAQAIQLIHIVTVPDDHEIKGEWFDLEQLPDTFLHAQQSMIDFALDRHPDW